MKMRINLNAPGMTSLHKAGLAGLYMTLLAFEETNQEIKGLSWEIHPTQVTLDWEERNLKETFEQFIKKSFWLDNGFIRLKGLELSLQPGLDQKYQLYTALLNSFLQFGPHRPTDTKQNISVPIDDRVQWIKDFGPIKEFRHQFAADDFINDKGEFRKSVEVSGWLYPGAGQRHVVYANTRQNESPELALALLFAPVGVIYYTIKSRTKGRKARLAMVIPEIPDLSLYAEIRQVLAGESVFDLTASSASDAVLRMLTTIAVNSKFNELFGRSFVCRVITFGIVSWNEKQKSRTDSRTVVSGQLRGFKNYLIADSIFKNRWQRIPAKVDRRGREIEPERSFVITFSAREMIAENVAAEKPWYWNIATYLSNPESRKQLQYERKELNEMVRTASFDEDGERLFIEICHESWRRRLGKLGQRASSENTSFSGLARKEAEKLRNALIRCKNAETLRETVVDFWSRAGANRSLRGIRVTTLLRLFDESNWKKARDLALLALISYQPQNEQEEAALDEPLNNEGDEHV